MFLFLPQRSAEFLPAVIAGQTAIHLPPRIIFESHRFYEQDSSLPPSNALRGWDGSTACQARNSPASDVFSWSASIASSSDDGCPARRYLKSRNCSRSTSCRSKPSRSGLHHASRLVARRRAGERALLETPRKRRCGAPSPVEQERRIPGRLRVTGILRQEAHRRRCLQRPTRRAAGYAECSARLATLPPDARKKLPIVPSMSADQGELPRPASLFRSLVASGEYPYCPLSTVGKG